MPQLIEHIDAIARREQRAVLYLEFHPEERSAQRRYQFQLDPARERVLGWLDANGIGFVPCGEYANPDRMASWRGQVCLAVPYDDALPQYQLLRDYLEHPDGSMRDEGVRFCVLGLEAANRNASHDAPGFWENLWADRF